MSKPIEIPNKPSWRERMRAEEERRSKLTPEQIKAEDEARVAEMEAERLEEEEKLRAERLENLLRTRITRRHLHCTVENFDAETEKAKRVKSVVKRYADNAAGVMENGACMIFCGDTGTGKTHKGFALVRRWLELGMDARYTTIPEMLAEIRRTYGSDFDSGDGESKVIEKYSSCHLLVLDEAGAHRSSEHAMEMLFTIVNQRSNRVLPTILISNLTFSELSEAVGSRVVSRLREGGGPVLVFDWHDYRQHSGKAA